MQRFKSFQPRMGTAAGLSVLVLAKPLSGTNG